MTMASFQAKIGWKRLRKRGNKNYRYVTFPPDGLEKITKKQQKNFEVPLWHHFKPKYVEKGRESEKKKISFRSVPFLPDRLEKIPKKQLNK